MPGRLIKKIVGGPVSDNQARRWPALAGSFATQSAQMPREASKTNHVGEMGPIFRALNPTAYAATGPFGTIKLNRELIERENQDIGDVLTHEMAHVGQGPMGWLKNAFGIDSDKLEHEAINKEALRKVRRGDIYLR